MTDPMLQFGEFTYDPAQETLSGPTGGEPELRPQSLAVLQLLASKPGQVIAKDEFFTTVWPGVTVTDDSLVQCIGDIRRVLGDDNRKILKTVPRRGYVLQAEQCFRNDHPVETGTKVNRWEDSNTITSGNKRGSAAVSAFGPGDHKAFSILNLGKIKKSAFGFFGLVALFAAIWIFRDSGMSTGGNVERSEVMALSGSKVDSVMSRFIDKGEGVVLDRGLNILWKKCSEGLSGENCASGKIKKYRWDDAMKLNDFMWRLPSIDELRTLVYCDNNILTDEALDKSCAGAENKGGEFSRPTINSLVFPNTGSGRYWSSTTYRFDFEAWVVSFYEGRHSALNKKELRRVRLIRRNPAPDTTDQKLPSTEIPSSGVLPIQKPDG